MPSSDDPVEKLRVLAGAYQATFSGPAGELVLNDLLREAGMLLPSHAPGDPHETAFRDGKRTMGIHVLEKLRWTEMSLAKLASVMANQGIAEQAGES